MNTKSILAIAVIVLAVVAFWLLMRDSNNEDALDIIEEPTPTETATTSPATSASPTSSPKTITMENGLKIEEVQVGTGAQAKAGDTISAHYTGYFTDGKIFDSSSEGSPISFKLGAGNVIQGWDLGLVGMKVGGKRKLTIPPDLAYGPDGIPNAIPPNSTLIFDVELVKIGE